MSQSTTTTTVAAVNSIFDEVSEIGEILALLNAGSISHEEAKTQLEKFNTSPSRVLESESKDVYEVDEEDSVNEILNNLTPLTSTPVNHGDLIEEELIAEPIQKPKRGRPKKLTNHQVKAQEKRRAKSHKKAVKNASVFAMIRRLSKKDKKQLLKELMQSESGSNSNSGDELMVAESDSDIEVDNSLRTHYNMNQKRGERVEEEQEIEEEEKEHSSTPNDRYIPAFLSKKIDIKDKNEFNRRYMIDLLNQIKKDRCSKQEAERRVCEYLNQFFAVVTSQNHEAMMIQKIYKPEFGHCDLSETSINSFIKTYSNLDVCYVLPNGHIKIRKVGDFYVESTHRLDYNRIVFNPYPHGHDNAASEKDLNMFSGLPFNEEECRKCYLIPEVKRKMDWIRDQYILKTIANEDKFAFNVFEHWFGAKIKEPWRKLNWMILFYGGFGSGKSTLMKKIIKVIFGVYCKIISDIKAVFGEFDSIKKNALIILLDESVAPETKAQEAKLTSEITSTFYTSRELYKNAEPKLCFHEYIGGVNPKNKVYLNVGDRRVFVIKTNEEMTLTQNCQSGAEQEKVDYWNKVNEYLDDVRVVKAYQYHLQCMLQPDPNINIGLHAPYSKIKDELLLLQSPDSLSFAKTIITRGYIVPQSRLQDCKQEFNHQFTNLQGRVVSDKGQYDSPWVRELCTKDVEKEFRLLFPHSTIKNNTLWRELCHIFDIKTKEEDRILEASMASNGSGNGNGVSSIIMTRFHKNPNVKTKINTIRTFEKGSLIKKFVTKNGKVKNKTYYLWPTFSDAYSQFTAKTKLIVELSPEAKATFEKERLGVSKVAQPISSRVSAPSANNNNNNNNNKKKRKFFDESKKYAHSASSSSDESDGEELVKRPLKKRRVTAEPTTTAINQQQQQNVSSASNEVQIKVPDITSIVMDQLKTLMENQMAQQMKQLKDDFFNSLQQQQQQHQNQQIQYNQHQQYAYQPDVHMISDDRPSLSIGKEQQQPQQQQQQQSVPIQVETIDFYHQNTQSQEPHHVKEKKQENNSKTNPIQCYSTRPYPEQEIIDVYDPLKSTNNNNNNNENDQMHFDSQHQNQESIVISENSNMADDDDREILLLATPLLPDTDPHQFREKFVKQPDLAKRINVNKMFEACKNKT